MSTLVPEKAETVIVKGGTTTDNVILTLNGTTVIPKKIVKYLGVILDSRGNFGPHVIHSAEKTKSRVASLIRLMPVIRGPSSHQQSAVEKETGTECPAMVRLQISLHRLLSDSSAIRSWCLPRVYDEVSEILGE